MSAFAAAEELSSLNKRLEEIGWALFLVMIGIFWLVPDGTVPQGTWIVGAGLIMLGVNAIRYFKRIAISGLSTALGLFALLAGLVSMAGVSLPLFPILLIVIGAVILLKPLFTTSTGVVRHDADVTR